MLDYLAIKKGIIMNQVSDIIKAFFEEFERANNTFDRDLLATKVSDPMVGAYPDGSTQVLTKADYLAGIPEQQAYLLSLGFQFLTIVPHEEIPLDDRYVMVKTHGTMRLEKIQDQPIDLVHDAAYILFIKDGSSQIVFTLTHEDPMKMAQEHGLFPANP
jgi:hypothetical protein